MILDTNILIAYLNGDRDVIDAVDGWRLMGRRLSISSISNIEVLALATLTTNEINKIKKFLDYFETIPFDKRLSEIAAYLMRIYDIKLPDATIAATAIVCQEPLVSRDRQFKKIHEIKVFEI